MTDIPFYFALESSVSAILLDFFLEDCLQISLHQPFIAWNHPLKKRLDQLLPYWFFEPKYNMHTLLINSHSDSFHP